MLNLNFAEACRHLADIPTMHLVKANNGGFKNILGILVEHLDHEHWDVLLSSAKRHFSNEMGEETCKHLNTSADESNGRLCEKLYHFALANRKRIGVSIEDLFPKPVFVAVRQKLKEHLSGGIELLPKPLVEVKKTAATQIATFRIDLEKFRSKKFKGAELDAFSAFDEASKNCGSDKEPIKDETFKKALRESKINETGFYDLFKAIKVHGKSIKGLQPAVGSYKTGMNKVVTQLISLANCCSKDEQLLRACLLDDLFYEFLLGIDDIYDRFPSIFPDTFWSIMTSYRPEEKAVLLNNEKQNNKLIKKPLNESHRAWQEGHKKGNPITPARPVTDVRRVQQSVILNLEKEVSPKQVNPAPLPANSPSPELMVTRVAPKKPQLFRIQDDERRYQLLSDDIQVGLNYLRIILNPKAVLQEDLKSKPLIEKLKKDNSMPDICFLASNRLIKDRSNEPDEEVMNALKEAAHGHKGKICYGIFNDNYDGKGLHWIGIAIYQPLNGSKTQILIMDPAFESDHKSHSKDRITRMLSATFPIDKTEIQFSDVTMQHNDADCGICCLQIGLDILVQSVLTTTPEKMLFHPDRLTMNARKYSADERSQLEYVTRAIRPTRQGWEDLLSQFEITPIFTHQQPTTIAGHPYNFKNSKRIHQLTETIENFRNKLLSNFIQHEKDALYLVISNANGLPPKDQGIFEKFYQDFKDYEDGNNNVTNRSDFVEFENVLKEMLELYRSSLEECPYHQNTIKDDLYRAVVQDYKHKKFPGFLNGFKTFLANDKAIPLNSMPDNLREMFREFVAKPENKWVEEFDQLPGLYKIEANLYQSVHSFIERQVHANNRPAALPSAASPPRRIVVPAPAAAASNGPSSPGPENGKAIADTLRQTQLSIDTVSLQLKLIAEKLAVLKDLTPDKEAMRTRLSADIPRWRAWCVNPGDDQDIIDGQMRKIVELLHHHLKKATETKTSKVPTFLGGGQKTQIFHWGPKEIAGAIVEPFARMVGVEESRIIAMNSPEEKIFDTRNTITGKVEKRTGSGYYFLNKEIEKCVTSLPKIDSALIRDYTDDSAIKSLRA